LARGGPYPALCIGGVSGLSKETFRCPSSIYREGPVAGSLFWPTCACEPNGHVVIVISEENCSSARPACGLSRRRNDHGYEQEGFYFTTQQKPEGAKEGSVETRLPVCHQERECRTQAGTAQDDGRLPVRHQVPGCSREVPLLRRIAHSSTLDLWRVKITIQHTGPLRIPLARQSSEPDVLALNP
jgi:hypothetical protein